MSYPIAIIKNIDSESHSILGTVIAPTEEYTVPDEKRIAIANNDTILDKISQGLLQVSDGVNLISGTSAQIDRLKGNVPKEVTLEDKPSSQAPVVQLTKSTGYSKAHVSHNFSDRCTWYSQSTRVTGETLTGSGTGPYNSGNAFWIDLAHARHTREDEISAPYLPVVYDNGTPLIEGNDFTINYEAGTVTFNSTPTGPVTADYSYENGSAFILAPESGKILRLEKAELDFSVDLVMSKTHFEVWAYNPSDLPNKMMVERVTYKNEKDILAVGNEVQEIAAWGSLVKAVKRVEFDYGRTIDLDANLGMELRIIIDDDEPFNITDSSSFGTITLYCADDE